MCGIVGIINNETIPYNSKELFKFFNQALLCDSLRGMHGTGVLGVTRKREESVYKKPINAFDFLELSRTKKIIEDTDNIFLIGHNRWATTGSHSIENSHPFYHGDITLFHNGSLTGGYRMLSKETFAVDSEYICHAISEAANPVEILEKLDGAYSLVWYDASNETLNFARNNDRPMFFAKLENSNSMIFGSEAKMLEWIAARNAIKIEAPWSLKPGLILSIPLKPDKDNTHTTTPFKIKEAYAATNYYQGSRSNWNYSSQSTGVKTFDQVIIGYDYVEADAKEWCPWNQVQANDGYLLCTLRDLHEIKVNMSKELATTLIGKTVKINVTSYASSTQNFFGRLYEEKKSLVVIPHKKDNVKPKHNNSMSVKEFKKRIRGGCSLCSDNLTYDMRNIVKWTANDDPLCPECYDWYINDVNNTENQVHSMGI